MFHVKHSDFLFLNLQIFKESEVKIMAFGNATKGYVKKHSGGGGGGGTSNYNQLSNKPQINGVTLDGNKTSENLNIAVIMENITTNITDSSVGINVNDYDLIIIDALDSVSQLFSGTFAIESLSDGLKVMSSTTNSYFVEVCHIVNNKLYLTKNDIGTPVTISHVYGIKF